MWSSRFQILPPALVEVSGLFQGGRILAVKSFQGVSENGVSLIKKQVFHHVDLHDRRYWDEIKASSKELRVTGKDFRLLALTMDFAVVKTSKDEKSLAVLNRSRKIYRDLVK